MIGSIFIEGQSKLLAVLFYTLVVLMLIMATRPLGRWAEQSIDRLFYRKTYDYRWLLMNFSDKMSNILDLDALSKEMLPALTSALNITKSEMMFQDTDSGDFKAQYIHPEPGEKTEDDVFSFNLDSPIIARLNKLTGPLYLKQIDNIAELKGLWQAEKEKLAKSGLGNIISAEKQRQTDWHIGVGRKANRQPLFT